MKCRRCNKTIPVNAKYCQHCGKRQTFSIFHFLFKLVLIITFSTGVVSAVLIYKYKFEIYQYFIKPSFKPPATTKAEDAKNNAVYENFKECVFGIDVSSYQGNIEWEKVKELKEGIPIQFVFIRATMGDDSADKEFFKNWKNAKKQGYTRGAYHYYRPNENSYKQAERFINTVSLSKGDMVPVLDIEEISTKQSMNNLRLGLKRWLTKVEEHYGVKPIIYTADAFYNRHLNTDEFDDYTIWIANFNQVKKPWTSGWKIWQFTEKGNIPGINHHVDYNVYKGNITEFNELIIK